MTFSIYCFSSSFIFWCMLASSFRLISSYCKICHKSHMSDHPWNRAGMITGGLVVIALPDAIIKLTMQEEGVISRGYFDPVGEATKAIPPEPPKELDPWDSCTGHPHCHSHAASRQLTGPRLSFSPVGRWFSKKKPFFCNKVPHH